jgi:Arc/MetJ family transcription regulator
VAMNLDLDPDLVERALLLSGESSQRAAVMSALREFVARREQRRILELFGQLDWDSTYDYKQQRSRE